MEDIHKIFGQFKSEFPEIHQKHEALGKAVHEKGGPLSEKSRWLIKIAISAACNHKRALETHLQKWRPIFKKPGPLVLPKMKSSMPYCC
jgi:alkylhydroperoxidase/carboxymuconolactone decarboxylase family protein YurZ